MASLRILMYSNDSGGLGHTSRTVSIATALAKALSECSILVLTDLSTIGRFKLPERVDYIHLPLLNGKPHHQAAVLGLDLSPENTLKIRRKIAQSAIKTFQPDLVILDDSLLHLPFEMQKLVADITTEAPQAKIVWGLSDTLGEPAQVMRQLARYEIQPILERFAQEILVFGVPQLFDVARQYHLSAGIARKLTYTGYLACQTFPPRRVNEDLTRFNRRMPIIALAPEGSAHDFAMVDAYLRFLERRANGNAIQSLIVAGPGISSPQKQALALRAKRLPNVIFHRSDKYALQYLGLADMVICAGGYNAMCEILAHRKKAILVPSLQEQPDNFYRARLFQQRGLVTMISLREFHPAVLNEKVADWLDQDLRLFPKNRYEEIALDGLANITERIRQLFGLTTPPAYQLGPLMAAA
jgi:predicted glycosyltransferase